MVNFDELGELSMTTPSVQEYDVLGIDTVSNIYFDYYFLYNYVY